MITFKFEDKHGETIGKVSFSLLSPASPILRLVSNYCELNGFVAVVSIKG